MSAKPDFRRGAEAAKEATRGGNYARTEFFSLEDGKTAILRFLTDADEWITVAQHQMIKTKAQPDGYTGNWPERMGCVCRDDDAFAGIYDDCYICSYLVDGDKIKKPSSRIWALACLREEVLGDGSTELGGPEMKGKRVGLRDMTREVTISAKEAADGKPARKEETITEKAVVVVNMGWKNFFGVLEGYAAKYGTVLDRDFWIKRNGAGLDTSYQIISEDPIMSNGEVFDLREPKFMERYETNIDLVEIITDRSSNEFYARFFDPRFSSDDDGEVKATGATPEAKPTTDVDPERMEALANRVRGYKDDGKPAEAGDGEKAVASSGGMKDFG